MAKLKGKYDRRDCMNRLKVSKRGGNCERNCSLTAVSVSLGAPRKAQLAGWLLARHVWPT